jgi:uncharacterized protein (TIGR02246 family)
MLASIRLALVVFLVAAACRPKTETAAVGVEEGAQPADASAEDVKAIHAVDDEWGRAASAGDGNAVAALYAADATLLPPGEALVQGEAAKKYWTDYFTSYAGPTKLETSDVKLHGNLAVAVGTYRMTMTEKKAGAKPLPTEEGKYVEVLMKQADGSWKMIYDIWNLNAPPPKQ